MQGPGFSCGMQERLGPFVWQAVPFFLTGGLPPWYDKIEKDSYYQFQPKAR